MTSSALAAGGAPRFPREDGLDSDATNDFTSLFMRGKSRPCSPADFSHALQKHENRLSTSIFGLSQRTLQGYSRWLRAIIPMSGHVRTNSRIMNSPSLSRSGLFGHPWTGKSPGPVRRLPMTSTRDVRMKLSDADHIGTKLHVILNPLDFASLMNLPAALNSS